MGLKLFSKYYSESFIDVISSHHDVITSPPLTLSRRRSLSYRNQSADLQNKLMDWFLYGRVHRHERVNQMYGKVPLPGVNSIMQN